MNALHPKPRPVPPSGVLCVIPARGGSRRLPGKNLVPLAGRPLVVHTIEHAVLASEVTRVVVSTDSGEIADAARMAGAEVVARPPSISGDEATSESAVLHTLDVLQQQEGFEPELVVLLQCTSPFRTSADIDGAVRLLRAEKADSLLSVVEWRRFVWRVSRGRALPMNYEIAQRPRTQDMAPLYLENGSIYVFTPALLRRTHNRLGDHPVVFVMGGHSAIDIDEQWDLELCEWVMNRLSEEPPVNRE